MPRVLECPLRSPKADMRELTAICLLRANRDLMRRGKKQRYSITSSASASTLSGIVMPRRLLACQATEHRNGTLLGGEAIEQPVAAGAAQVGLATAAIGPARGMR